MTRDCALCGGTGEIALVLTNQVVECRTCRGYGTVRDEGDNEGGGFYSSSEPAFHITDKDHLGRGGLR